MLITPFRVRLASKGGGFKQGLVGDVVGEEWIQNPETKSPIKVYSVVWYNYDEVTGEESISDYPAPSIHLSEELRAAPQDLFEEDENEIDDDNITNVSHANA